MSCLRASAARAVASILRWLTQCRLGTGFAARCWAARSPAAPTLNASRLPLLTTSGCRRHGATQRERRQRSARQAPMSSVRCGDEVVQRRAAPTSCRCERSAFDGGPAAASDTITSVEVPVVQWRNGTKAERCAGYGGALLEVPASAAASASCCYVTRSDGVVPSSRAMSVEQVSKSSSAGPVPQKSLPPNTMLAQSSG